MRARIAIIECASSSSAEARRASGVGRRLRRHPAGRQGVAPGRDVGRLVPEHTEDGADVGAQPPDTRTRRASAVVRERPLAALTNRLDRTASARAGAGAADGVAVDRAGAAVPLHPWVDTAAGLAAAAEARRPADAAAALAARRAAGLTA